MERSALYARIDERVDAMVAAGAAEEVRRADAAGASRTARAALGFEELLSGDVEAMKRRTRNYAKRQLTWLRRLPGRARDRPDRRRRRGRGGRRRAARPEVECRAVRFEKWQALGNDYVIVEERELPFPLTPGRIRALCAPHTGIGVRRRAAAQPRRRARLRRRAADLQPRRLGGRAVGQRRARGGALPAPQRLGGRGQLLGAHGGGRDPAAHHRAGHLHDGHGHGSAALGARLPERGRGRRRHDRGGGPGVRLPVRAGGQPAVLDRGGRRASRSSTWRATAPPSSATSWFPRRTNVSFWQRTGDARDPGAHLRARRGGDDVLGHRRLGRGRGRGAAAAWRAR